MNNEERAAVVAYIRKTAQERNKSYYKTDDVTALDQVADDIERGLHLIHAGGEL